MKGCVNELRIDCHQHINDHGFLSYVADTLRIGLFSVLKMEPAANEKLWF